MTDHKHFEELAALSAAGLLSGREIKELREHAQACSECSKAESDFTEIFRSGLPLTANPVREFLRQREIAVDDEMRNRFLARARWKGIQFSPEVLKKTGRQPARVGSFAAALAAAGALILIVFFGLTIYKRTIWRSPQSEGAVAQLEQRNAALSQSIAQLNRSLAAQQNEIRNLQAKLGIATKATASLRQENAREKSEIEEASEQTVQFPAELENREKQLGDARSEIERINKLHVDDEASLVAQQARIAELSDQLRVASATLNMERQLTAAGKDIRELMAARQLHVIDVRDVGANGRPGKAFGRIFVIEGKSLIFYAFDLNDDRATGAKRRYEVWGSQVAKGAPPLRLGSFYIDDKSQGRWALKVSAPGVIEQVSSVFVTQEPSAGSASPTGQPLLFAGLGQPDHP